MKKRKANKYIKNLVKNNLNQTKAYQETNNCSYATAQKNSYKTYRNLETTLDDMAKYGNFPLEKVTPEYIIGRLTELSNTTDNESVKCRALELLGKFRALFTDKVEQKTEIYTKEQKQELVSRLQQHLIKLN